MSYIIEVSLNDTTCAVFQVVSKQILHMVDTELDYFKPNDDPSKYYMFDTEQDANDWFEIWYQDRRKNYNKLPQLIPLPGKDKFKVIIYNNTTNYNSYTVLNIPPG